MAGHAGAPAMELEKQKCAMVWHYGTRWIIGYLHHLTGPCSRSVRQKRGESRPDVAAAESALMRAIEIARSQQTRTFELRAALSLARVYQRTGRGQAASELLGPTLVCFKAGPQVPEVEEAQRLLAMHEPAARPLS